MKKFYFQEKPRITPILYLMKFLKPQHDDQKHIQAFIFKERKKTRYYKFSQMEVLLFQKLIRGIFVWFLNTTHILKKLNT